MVTFEGAKELRNNYQWLTDHILETITPALILHGHASFEFPKTISYEVKYQVVIRVEEACNNAGWEMVGTVKTNTFGFRERTT
ncbi:MAG: hypothetical protein AAB458_01285 [Patescibacteria group bacterium]